MSAALPTSALLLLLAGAGRAGPVGSVVTHTSRVASGAARSASHGLDGVAQQLAAQGGDAAGLFGADLPRLRRLETAGDALALGDALGDLARASRAAGDYKGARVLTSRALLVKERALGSEHPRLVDDLAELALEIYLSGDSLGAAEPALRAENLAREQLELLAHAATEEEALRYARRRTSCLDLLVTLASLSPEAPFTTPVWQTVFRARGLVLDELASRHRAILLSRDPDLAAVLDSLGAARGQLARETLLPPDSVAGDYADHLDSARAECRRLEGALAGRSALFRAEYDRARVDHDEIASRLGPGDALLAFVRHRHLARRWIAEPDSAAPRIASGGGEATASPGPWPPRVVPATFTPATRAPRHAGRAVIDTTERYVAFVLVPGREPAVVPLGDAAGIDRLVRSWRLLASQGWTTHDAENACRAAGAALRRRVWDSALPAIGSARRVFVVPDAALELVSFDALPLDSSSYLVEGATELRLLETERDLVNRAPAPAARAGMIALGGADFDSAAVFDGAAVAIASDSMLASALAPDTTGGDRLDAESLRAVRPCADLGPFRFEKLTRTAGEAQHVASLWRAARDSDSTLVLVGPAASEEAFERLAPGRRVLHVATHGFFLETLCAATPADSSSPLLRCGLVLAGANRANRMTAGGEDGLLTAEEIATLDLSAARLVVLSACNTGVGEVLPGEGVFGLRRALAIAGAPTIVMSLWPVGDETASAWMEEFYRAFAPEERGVAACVREAERRRLEALRRSGRGATPGEWAPFIAVGDVP